MAHKSGGLIVTCSGGSGSGFVASVKVTGDKGRYTNTLKMNMADATKAAPAEIRGIIGPDTPNFGICDGDGDYPGWIQFTPNGRVIKVGDLSAGHNEIPYSFTVCSNGGSILGKASAMATLDLTWD
ncbi:hypothetical protein [Morganella morganii]|uniref:hypothetical protein n=1 Tax=Morganella morganii TaxID=582 RepID=UPI0011E5D13D|nr:hypothetical protein [Morganella morganii]